MNNEQVYLIFDLSWAFIKIEHPLDYKAFLTNTKELRNKPLLCFYNQYIKKQTNNRMVAKPHRFRFYVSHPLITKQIIMKLENIQRKMCYAVKARHV